MSLGNKHENSLTDPYETLVVVAQPLKVRDTSFHFFFFWNRAFCRNGDQKILYMFDIPKFQINALPPPLPQNGVGKYFRHMSYYH